MQKNTKNKIIKISVALLVIAGISVGLYFLFNALGITDVNKLQEIIQSCGAWGWVIFLLLQIITTTLLCFVPATSMVFITVGVILFGANWKTFLLCFGGVLISSICMYAIGRFGGNKLVEKIMGKEDTEKATKLMKEKGTIYFPAMMIFPAFPDDALCGVAGISKMNIWFYLCSIIFGRGIGVATIVFGVNLLPKDLIDNLKAFNWEFIGNHLWDYLTMITVMVFWVLLIFYCLHKLDLFISKKRKENKNVLEQKEENEKMQKM